MYNDFQEHLNQGFTFHDPLLLSCLYTSSIIYVSKYGVKLNTGKMFLHNYIYPVHNDRKK